MARILGIDIDSGAVRGTFLRTALRKHEVVRYVEVPIEPVAETPGEAPAGDEDARVVATRAAVQAVLSADGRPPDQVIAALDGREASLRVVELPAAAAKRVAEVLPFELESLVPFEMDEAVIDHQPVDRVDATLRLLAAAVPRARVEARLAELTEIGVDARELAVGPAALDGLVPLVSELQTPGPHVVVDIRSDETDVCILHNGHCEMSRTLSSGMDDVRSGARSRLEDGLRRTIAGYRSAGGPPPALAHLCGEAALDPVALEWLGGLISCEARPVVLPATEEAPVPQGLPRYARSAALAGRIAARGRHLNLRQGELAPQRAMGAVRQHVRLLTVCAASVLLSFGFSTFARWYVLDSEQETLQAQLEHTTDDLFGVKTASASQARELLAGGRRSGDPLPRFDAFDALDAVSGLVPPDVTHDVRRLTIDIGDSDRQGQLDLQGTLNNQASFESIAEAMRQHECFTEVEPGRTTPANNDRLNYQLQAVIRCPGQAAPAKNKNRGRHGSR